MPGAGYHCRSAISRTGLRASGGAYWCFRTNSAATVMHWTVKADLRDPALDTVATRLTQDQLIRQVLQGRGEAQLGGLSRGLLQITSQSNPPQEWPPVSWLKKCYAKQ